MSDCQAVLFDISKKQASRLNLKKFEPMVHKFVNGLYARIIVRDPSVTRDDLVQTAWVFVCEAANEYNPKRGAKLSTFVFLKLMTKFGNLLNKLVCFSMKAPILAGDIMSRNVTCDDDSDDFMPEVYLKNSNASESMETAIDGVKIFLKLNDSEKKVMLRFITGYNTKEIAKRYNYRSVSYVNQTLKSIETKAKRELETVWR